MYEKKSAFWSERYPKTGGQTPAGVVVVLVAIEEEGGEVDLSCNND